MTKRSSWSVLVISILSLGTLQVMVSCKRPSSPDAKSGLKLHPTVDKAEVGSPTVIPVDDPSSLVTISLVADVARFEAGEPFDVGIHFKVAPGWHIYWENPGDAGLKTSARLTLPDGYGVGPIRYPGPMSFESPGQIISYGYNTEVMLFAEMMGSASTEGSNAPVNLLVEAKWLACRESCIPGSASEVLELVPGKTAGVAEMKALLDQHRSQLPRAPLDQVRTEILRDASNVRLKVTAAGATSLEFFPGPQKSISAHNQRQDLPDTLIVQLETIETTPAMMVRGVLRVDRGASRDFYQLELPWPG